MSATIEGRPIELRERILDAMAKAIRGHGIAPTRTSAIARALVDVVVGESPPR